MFRAFDPVVIRLSLDTTNVQREKIVFELVKPFIPGFSVEPMDVEPSDEQQSSNKRKSIDTTTIADDETEESSTPKTKSKKNKKTKKWSNNKKWWHLFDKIGTDLLLKR